MDIVVSGRNVEVPDHYRQHVADKLSKIERFDHKLIRIDVELQHEPNRRQSSACQHVEITCKSRGPVVRSEACAADFYAALDAAAGKLESRLRRAADRRRVHYGQHRPRSVQDAVSAEFMPDERPDLRESGDHHVADVEPADEQSSAELYSDSGAEQDHHDDMLGRVVRHKEHDAAPMTVDQALHHMELVGHDFYLFADAESGLPSVVYRRKGYAYGVIRLNAIGATGAEPAHMTSPEPASAIPSQARAFAAQA